MKSLLMMIGAAAIVAMADVALATDLDSYLFRYDFSSGEKVFFGSAAQLSDPLVSGGTPVYNRVYGPNGDSTAVHPSSVDWGTIGTATLNADWTLAMFARPGSVEGQVIVGLGRLNGDNKKSVVFSASSDPTKFKVYVEKRVPSNKKSHETTLTLDVGNTAGFHSIVAVHHAPPSGNKGMLQIYWDGVLKATYTMTTDIPFGDVMQFCASPTAFISPCVTSTDNPDVAFHDLRFFSRAFTAADAAAYAAKYPAGTLRQSAYVQSASKNAVDTGYLTNPGTRYTADFQFLDNTKQARIFGAYGAAGCNLYVNSSTMFGYAMRDGGAGWSDFGVGVDYRRRVVTEDAFANSATLRLVQTPGGVVTKSLGGTHTNTATIFTTLYAERQEVDGEYMNPSTSRIYSFAIDETTEVEGANVVTPIHFFVPYNDATLGAGFTNIVAGTFHGEANGSVTPALSYCGGVGGVEDYKYEDGVLSAKIYVASANPSKGLVQVGEDAATDAASFWLDHEATVTLTAVPQGGAEFLGWFGDLGAIQNGGTATNLAITVKSASAAQFEARFGAGAWAERYDSSMPRFAKRAQDFDVGDYVQSGLVLHFDGIRNAGASAPHDPAATTWVNLGTLGSAQNAAKTTLASSVPSGAAAGEWADDGYAFKGKEYFALGGTVSLGSELTTQVSADYDESAQVANYPALFGATASSSRDDYYFYFNRVNNAGAVPVFKQNHAAARNMGRRYTGSHLTAIYDAPNSRVSVEDAVLPSWQAASTTAALGNWPYAIGTGRATDTEMGVRMYLGKIRSVRVYNRVLDAAELAVNRIVDDARFSGKIDADFVVAENPRGFEGVEGAGDYMVNGSHTFTATNLTFGVFAWSPVGYALERWNEDSRAWEFVSDGAGASYTYVNSKANGKMRLSWIWTQTGAVKGGYEPGDYIQDGLLLHFDGIRNAGADAAHDSSAATWVNLGSLGSGKNATLTALASSIPSDATDGAWSDGGYRFGGKQYFAIGGTVALGGALTVQIAADYKNEDQLVLYPAFFGQTSNNSDNFMVYFNRSNGDDAAHKTLRFKLLAQTVHGATSVWSGPFATAIYDKSLVNGVSIGNTVLPQWQKRNASGDIPAYSYAIGTTRNTDAERGKSRMLVGTMKSVRVYDRVLPDFALTHNHAIDEVRFNGNVTVVNGAVGETGNVGSSSATDGVYDVASGTWTVTAADDVVDGRRYKPHLTVETLTDGEWVQTAKLWTDSYTVDKTALGSSRIRLTWTWKVPVGTTIIFY